MGWVKANQSISWPKTQGQLQKVNLVTHYDSEGDTYHNEVSYLYSVDGLMHIGQNLAFGYSGSSNKSEHQNIYDKLFMAKSIQVSYNPNNPQESVIAIGQSKSNYLMIIFGVTWTGFVIGFSLLWFLSLNGDLRLLTKIVVLESKVMQVER